MASVRAATLLGPERLEVRSYPYPDELEPGAVLLRMLASGICGTDKHTFRGETEQYEGTLALLARHDAGVPFADMVSHRFDVQDAPEAMRTALDAEASAKVLITAA